MGSAKAYFFHSRSVGFDGQRDCLKAMQEPLRELKCTNDANVAGFDTIKLSLVQAMALVQISKVHRVQWSFGKPRRGGEQAEQLSRCTQIADFDPDPRHTVLKSRILMRVCIQIADAVQGIGDNLKLIS